MADLIGPFDSVPWSQDQWFRFAPAWAASGIIGTPAASVSTGSFGATASGLNVTVATGRHWIRGAGFEPETAKVLATSANANASLSRRDRVVVRRDLAAQTITIERLAGTPAGTPSAPAVTQSETGIWEAPLFSYLVPPNNGTTLTSFTDERAWLDPSTGQLMFGSIAARDAHFPAPVVNNTALVGGLLYIHDGSTWRAPRATSDTTTVTLNSNGDANIAHGLGAVPDNVTLGLIGTTGANQVGVIKQYQDADATNIFVRVTDSRDGTPMAGWAGTKIMWKAEIV